MVPVGLSRLCSDADRDRVGDAAEHDRRLAVLGDADRRQHDRRGAGRQQVDAVSEKLLRDAAGGADIALGVLIVEDEIFADLEPFRLEAVDEALPRGIERRVIDELREADPIGPTGLRLRVRGQGQRAGATSASEIPRQYRRDVGLMVIPPSGADCCYIAFNP